MAVLVIMAILVMIVGVVAFGMVVRVVVLMTVVLMTVMVMMHVVGSVMTVFMGVAVRLERGVARLFGLRGIDRYGVDDVALYSFATVTAARIAVSRPTTVGATVVLFFSLAMCAFVGLDQCLTVGDRNLVVVGVDFAESEKTVAVATVFDEGGLQRRFYARDLGEVDVATKLLALRSLEIKLFDAIAANHDDPGLFRVGRIDQHFVWHLGAHGGGRRA